LKRVLIDRREKNKNKNKNKTAEMAA